MVAPLWPPAARWQVAPADPVGQRALIDALGVSAVAAQVLINRGLRSPAAAAAFLAPGLDRFSDPFTLEDMDRAVDRLARAVREQAPIVIYGDYDADGITATAMLVRALRDLGAVVDFFIPDRRTEGYGLRPEAVVALASQGARVVVAADCGVTATDAAEAAQAAGVDLVILDHHEPLDVLPHAAALVDPKRQDPPPAGDFCAAGLAYQACRALYEAMGGRQAPDDLLGLAALGTVADVVVLLGDNRILVAVGLDQLARTGIAGIEALAAIAGLRPPLRTRDLSHGLAPRLNAAGRLAHARAAVRLLLTDDPAEARELAEALDRLNQERRALCDTVLADCIAEIEQAGLDRHPAMVLARSGWHPGVIGIVASQLVERYYRPTVLIALEDGVGRGSARSIGPFHLVEALHAAAGRLLAYGGHAMAAGLTVAADAVPQFTETFVQVARERLRPEDLQPVTIIDAEVPLEALTPPLAAELERLAPHGNGNPEPVLMTHGLRVVGTRLVGDGTHLRLVVSDGVRTVEGIAFRHGDRAELLAFTQARIDLAYTVEINRWRDAEDLQVVVTDLQTPGVDLEAVATDTGAVLDRLFSRAQDYLGPRRREVEEADAFYTKVVGVTFEGRQALLPAVRPGMRLPLARDPQNPRDPHAIKVLLPDGRQVGFLRAALAARLAPAVDAGARYAATATAVTGGGDRAWGLNILIEREAPWAREEAESSDFKARWPAGPGFAERMASALCRGRPPSPAPRTIVDRLLAGHRVVARIGPGRGLLPGAIMAATALLAQGARPVLVVLPRAGVVDAWHDLAGPWLRELGMRTGAVHAGLAASAAGRIADALSRGTLDVLFASELWVDQALPEAGAVVVVGDHLTAPEEMGRVLERHGESVRLIAGPVAAPLLSDLVRRFARESLVTDSAPRDNLRVVDRRGRAGAPDIQIGQGRPEKTLMLAPGEEDCVVAARSLRDRYPEAASRIAYYHAGLPIPLRRVLEDLFAAGRITVLVAGCHLSDPAIPPDVARVAAFGLHPDRLLASEELAAAGFGGRTAVIELAYGPEAFLASEADLDARFPSRHLLVKCYRALVAYGRAWTRSEDGADQPRWALPPAVLDASLEVLEEAGVVAREGTGKSARYSLAGLDSRVDLRRSLRYREGERARAALADLRAWAMGPASRILADLAGG
ncbi:MAG: single-stranded-DNA-specific exonuclease RecJ [Armatimonadetes bacterium]|nr:single-stranded-DNA-specific exonuclease RecJ [Armatimonadota bacterium]